MTCPRCHNEIRVPDEYADDCDALFILTLLHNRDDCPASARPHLDAMVREAAEDGLYESTADPKRTR